MWKIDKQFSCCYGHRVWSQVLNPEFCAKGDTQCKCRHLHGHEGTIHVYLEGDELVRGMVSDFKHLGFLKDFIDEYIDHKFIIDRNDPMYFMLVSSLYTDLSGKKDMYLENVFVPGTDFIAGQTIDLQGCDPNTPEYETLEGYMIVDFIPTSENLSKWMFDIAQSKLKKIGVKVAQVDWFETPKSRSSYRG